MLRKILILQVDEQMLNVQNKNSSYFVEPSLLLRYSGANTKETLAFRTPAQRNQSPRRETLSLAW